MCSREEGNLIFVLFSLLSYPCSFIQDLKASITRPDRIACSDTNNQYFRNLPLSQS